jgi:MFS family permease
VRTFWIAAILVGLMVGPNQSASRAMLATFTPDRKQGEFFGFFAFSGKLASVAGPLVYGEVLGATGSFRLAMGSILIFFVVGFMLLMFVDEERGIQDGHEARRGRSLRARREADSPGRECRSRRKGRAPDDRDASRPSTPRSAPPRPESACTP